MTASDRVAFCALTALSAITSACAPDLSVENFEALVGCWADDRGRPILEIRPDRQVMDPAGRRLATAALDRRDRGTWLELRPGLKWSTEQQALIPTGSISEIHFAMRFGPQTSIALIPVEAEPPLPLRRSASSC